MATHREKIQEEAQKLVTKGQLAKAIVAYQKLLAEDPRDVRTLLKIGDLHTKLGQTQEAVKAYEGAAAVHIKQGFLPRAVALFKQILQAEPGRVETAKKLAQAYADQSLTSDALATYEQVKASYLARGELASAVETLEQMLLLDENNATLHMQYAETLAKAGRREEAAQAFAVTGELLHAQGRLVDYVRACEAEVQCAPQNFDALLRLGLAYLARRDPKRALSILGPLFKTYPGEVRVLEPLADAFCQLGQIPNAINVFKEIARLHHGRGEREPALQAIKRVTDLDPNDSQAARWVATISAAPPAMSQPPIVIGVERNNTKG